VSILTPVYVLIGNHDRPNNSDFLSDRHFFSALKYVPNITIVDRVVHLDHEASGHQFLFVPYVPNGRFADALATSLFGSISEISVIFAHQEFRTCTLNKLTPDVTSQDGDVWAPTAPFIVSGHIHDHQFLQGNILYPGTPMQHRFTDQADDKTISLLDLPALEDRALEDRALEDRALEDRAAKDRGAFIRAYLTETRLPLQIRRKVLVTLTVDQVDSYTPDLANDLKVNIQGCRADLLAVRNHPKIRDWVHAGVKIGYKELLTGEEQAKLNQQPFRYQAFPSLLLQKVKKNSHAKRAYDRLFPAS